MSKHTSTLTEYVEDLQRYRYLIYIDGNTYCALLDTLEACRDLDRLFAGLDPLACLHIVRWPISGFTMINRKVVKE